MPDSTATNHLLDLYRSGDLEAAERLCAEILETRPADPVALLIRGVLEARGGRYDTALRWFEQALDADAALASAHVNRGHALDALGRYHDAVAAYARAMALGADGAHLELRMASALERCGEHEAALSALDRALDIDPMDLGALFERVDLLLKLGRDGEAVTTLARARKAGGDRERVDYAMAALGLAPPTAASPRAYVRDLFDGYAASFDAHLVDHLRYRVPELIAALVVTLPGPRPLAAADLGCGTGLCGPVLRPHAHTLVGVDLSERMLERARARGDYDELVCEELCDFARARPAAFDLAVAADVFVYFGDLVPPLRALRALLRPGGFLVFSAESSAAEPVLLNRSRRFAHSRAHIEQAAAGWTVHEMRPCALRREAADDVAGWLVTLQRPA